MKSPEFDEYVGESTSNPQISGSCSPTSDDPHYCYSSSSESTSATLINNLLQKRTSIKLIRQLRQLLSFMVPATSNKEVLDNNVDSILEDAIKYIKQLEERVNELEEELKRAKCPSFCHPYSEKEELPEIEAKIDQEKNVIIRIICEKKNGFLTKIISEIEKLPLVLTNFTASPFGDYLLAITIAAQMGNELCITTNDLKRNLQLAFLEFM